MPILKRRVVSRSQQFLGIDAGRDKADRCFGHPAMREQGIHDENRLVGLRGKRLLHHKVDAAAFESADRRRGEIIDDDMDAAARTDLADGVQTGGDALRTHIDAADAAVRAQGGDDGIIGQIVAFIALGQADAVARDAERGGMAVKAVDTAAVGEKFQIAGHGEDVILWTDTAGEQTGGNLPALGEILSDVTDTAAQRDVRVVGDDRNPPAAEILNRRADQVGVRRIQDDAACTGIHKVVDPADVFGVRAAVHGLDEQMQIARTQKPFGAPDAGLGLFFKIAVLPFGHDKADARGMSRGDGGVRQGVAGFLDGAQDTAADGGIDTRAVVQDAVDGAARDAAHCGDTADGGFHRGNLLSVGIDSSIPEQAEKGIVTFHKKGTRHGVKSEESWGIGDRIHKKYSAKTEIIRNAGGTIDGREGEDYNKSSKTKTREKF